MGRVEIDMGRGSGGAFAEAGGERRRRCGRGHEHEPRPRLDSERHQAHVFGVEPGRAVHPRRPLELPVKVVPRDRGKECAAGALRSLLPRGSHRIRERGAASRSGAASPGRAVGPRVVRADQPEAPRLPRLLLEHSNDRPWEPATGGIALSWDVTKRTGFETCLAIRRIRLVFPADLAPVSRDLSLHLRAAVAAHVRERVQLPAGAAADGERPGPAIM
eukprot:gene2612-biopygen6538